VAGYLKCNRFLISRRLVQLSTLFLFFAGNAFGWTILRGNLSSSRVLEKVPLADPFAVLQIFATRRTVFFDAILGAVLITLFFAIVGGRAFCGWVCPVNIVTDFASRLRKILRVDSLVRNWNISSGIRYWMAGLSIILSVITGVAAFEWISPISMLHRGIVYGMGFGWTAVLGVFLFDLCVVKNGFCGHICPLGGFYALIGRFSILRVRHDRESCNLCAKCLEMCPERQVLSLVGKESGMVLSGECLNCGRCVEVCERGALKWSLRKNFSDYKARRSL
jgi:ferredoxin-type protein NapH